jgi:hypothetical protein
MYMKNKIAIIVVYLSSILFLGYLVWNTVPKKITVGEITYETMSCPRQSAFKKTLTLMHPKDKNVDKALEQMWKDYIHSDDPQVQEEYKQFVAKIVGGINEQLGPGYEVLAIGDNLTSIYVTNLKKKAKEDLKVEKALKSIKNI